MHFTAYASSNDFLRSKSARIAWICFTAFVNWGSILTTSSKVVIASLKAPDFFCARPRL